MKKHINPFKLFTILAFLLVPFFSIASDGDNVQKKKTISKSYSVTAADKLSIENSFGDVVISTWDKNEIQVDVEIRVNAATEEKAQQMMDEINVSDNKGGNGIRFKTDVGNMGNGKKNRDGGDQQRFYVDYKITMPSGNPLTIENSFGKISVGDFKGPVELTSKFGELVTGTLSNAKILHVEFGKAEIGPVTNADVTFKFNSSSIIKNIGGNSKVHTEFCNDVEFTVDVTLKDLYLFESYSNVRLNVPENLSASVQVHTNFGSFHNSSSIPISEEKEDDNSGPKFDRDYSGNSGNGEIHIRIKSSFGKVRLANAGDTSNDKNDSMDNDNDKGSKHKHKNKNKEDKDEDPDNVTL